jgi:hypothetical protein
MVFRSLVFILFLLSSQISFSQKKPKNSPRDFGFTSFSIKGTLDTINFIVSDTTFKKKKPLFLFCQGSLPYALFYKEDSTHTWQQSIPFDYIDRMNDYDFVVISKPAIPIFTTIADSNYFYIDPITKKVPAKFWIDNNLDYYVAAANDVINYLVKQKWIDKTKVIIAGHSQGSKIVSKLGVINKCVTHVIYLAGNPLGRFDQYIREERRDALTGKISSQKAQENINSLYKEWEKIAANPDDVSMVGDTYKATSSFSQPLLPYLLKMKIPLFVGYGTNDITSDYCDLLPIDFDRLHKTNLTLKPYLDCDHDFTRVIYDKSGKEISKENLWDKVADDFFEWITKN